MEQKCFTNDLHDALLTKSNDFWKSWRSKFRNNANHNTRHISGLINDADISAKLQTTSLVYVAQTIRRNVVNLMNNI